MTQYFYEKQAPGQGYVVYRLLYCNKEIVSWVNSKRQAMAVIDKLYKQDNNQQGAK